MQGFRKLVAGSLLLLVGACLPIVPPIDDSIVEGRVTSVTIDPNTLTLGPTKSAKLTATPKDANNVAVSSVRFTWSVDSNNTVALDPNTTASEITVTAGSLNSVQSTTVHACVRTRGSPCAALTVNVQPGALIQADDTALWATEAYVVEASSQAEGVLLHVSHFGTEGGISHDLLLTTGPAHVAGGLLEDETLRLVLCDAGNATALVVDLAHDGWRGLAVDGLHDAVLVDAAKACRGETR